MQNLDKPTTSLVNTDKVSIGETWSTWTTAWDDETRTWDELSQLIENSNKTFLWTDPITTAYMSPQTVTQVSGSNQWSNIDNIKTSNNSYASFSNSSFAGSLTTDKIKATNFGFNIPENATITKINARAEGLTLSGDERLENVKIIIANVMTGSTGSSAKLPMSDSLVAIYPPSNKSGTDYLWGTNPRPIDVNDSDFGISFNASISFGDGVYVDNIAMQIEYILPITNTITNFSKP